MHIYRKSKVADAVLSIIEVLLGQVDSEDEYIVCEMYSNAREQGYHLNSWDGKRRVSFSENRNSDNISVYAGGQFDFSMGGNIPNDAVYSNARYFSYDEYYKSAEFITAFLTNG